MARLFVDAASAAVNAAAGNRNPVHLGLSITDGAGNGVAGLAIANFAMSSLTVAPGGFNGIINAVTAGGIAGGYVVQVVPAGAFNWVAGTYIFLIDTFTPGGADDGQTVVNVTVP